LVSGESGMISWTGTMFEYLLPALWMKFFPNTLLEQAAQAAVLSHRNYAREKAIPWGISECSCANKGASGRYEYRAVGVPELALSTVNQDDLVVSPYSTFLALMIDGPAAIGNLREMQDRGWLGAYGFRDAYDFTADRLRPGYNCEIVACWMAHHQGMSMVAAANALNSNIMQRRFHAEPMVTATERLLQEASRNAPKPPAEESGSLESPKWLGPKLQGKRSPSTQVGQLIPFRIIGSRCSDQDERFCLFGIATVRTCVYSNPQRRSVTSAFTRFSTMKSASTTRTLPESPSTISHTSTRYMTGCSRRA
jgi:hypothetical protein